MKKLVAISIMAAMLLGICAAAALADASTWTVIMKASTSTNTLASAIQQYGTKTGAADLLDSNDTWASFPSGNAAMGSFISNGTGVPPLYGTDKRAPIVAGETKVWDIYAWLGTGYTGGDLKVIWYGTTSAALAPTIGGVAYTYTVAVAADPTGANANKSFVINPATASSSTTPWGSLSWTSAQMASLKMDASGAQQSAVHLTLTAAPAVVTPEPSSMLALASGLFGLVGFGIRRRK